MTIRVTVNGTEYEREVEPRLLLSDFLRHELGLTGTHVGCEHGVCGACTILLDRQAVRSCLLFAVQVDGQELVTVEGLAPAVVGPHVADGRDVADVQDAVGARDMGEARDEAEARDVAEARDEAAMAALHPLQAAFWEAHGLQCGFCTPGFLMSLVPFLEQNPNPSEEEIREALSGNLCRCTGYQKIVEAVKMAAERIAASP